MLCTGSGTGISSAITGTVVIGASDAYMPYSDAQKYPYVENIPIMISYQYIAYNIPGVSATLNLNGNVIAGIYMGTITNWDSPAIAALNPGVTLPNHTIIPVHRSDGSGDTFMFTSFLSLVCCGNISYRVWSRCHCAYDTSILGSSLCCCY